MALRSLSCAHVRCVCIYIIYIIIYLYIYATLFCISGHPKKRRRILNSTVELARNKGSWFDVERGPTYSLNLFVLSFAGLKMMAEICSCQDMSYGKGYGDYKGYGEILTCFLFNDLHNPKQVQIASVDYNMIE